jgi:hypothetical protein
MVTAACRRCSPNASCRRKPYKWSSRGDPVAFSTGAWREKDTSPARSVQTVPVSVKKPVG